MYVVYIMECGDGSLYTGITTNVERRFKEHQEKKGGHYTSSRKIVRIVYTEPCPDRSSALKREAAIKRLSRKEKISLIQPRSS